MSEILVLYKSKYGSTKQYAEWIAEDINADLRELSTFDVSLLGNYSTVIFCGGLYANTINGVKILAKKSAVLKGKKMAIVACGLSDPANEKAFKRVQKGLNNNFKRLKDLNVKLFLVQGGIHYAQMQFFDKTVMKFLKKSLQLKKPEALSAEERQMLAVLGKDVDFTNRADIQPIVEWCKAQ
jgi:menaquinone-dependent protoporphyrinogen IX oxidase